MNGLSYHRNCFFCPPIEANPRRLAHRNHREGFGAPKLLHRLPMDWYACTEARR